MSSLFKTVLQMSITASYVIAVVIVLRILMRRSPKKYSYYLWSVVFFRLCCPFSFSSVLSIFNFSAKRGDNVIIDLSGVPVSQSAVTGGASAPLDIGAPIITGTVIETAEETLLNPEVTIPVQTVLQQPVMTPIAEETGKIDLLAIAGIIWIIGIIVLITYALISSVRLRKSVELSAPLYNNIRQADIQSPFLLGLFNPTIYVPFNVDWSVLSMTIAHERYHQIRKDHWVRALSYCLLCVHWMNPLCWLAYNLMVKDMEMSCDEHVLAGGKDLRAAYSNALLSLSTKKMRYIVAPVTFGGVNVKDRIVNAMHFKRSGRITSLIAALICVLTLVSCAFNGKIPEALDPDTPSQEDSADDTFGLIRRIGIGEDLSFVSSTSCMTSHGLYEIRSWSEGYSNILYTDYDTRKTVFLCNIPGCSHNTPDCTSYIDGVGYYMFTDYSAKHLYLMFTGRDATVESEAIPASLTEMNMDGSERRTVCILPAGEEFLGDLVYVAGDDYVYLLEAHYKIEKEKVQVGDNEIEIEHRTEMKIYLVRVWFKDGKRETIRELKNNNSVYETLSGTIDDRYLVIKRVDYQSDGSTFTEEVLDQNGETIDTDGPYRVGNDCYYIGGNCISITRDGDTAAVSVEKIGSVETNTINGIPYPSNAGPAMIIGGYKEQYYMNYVWTEGNSDHERSLILDFKDGTWREFTMRMSSNSHYDVLPVAESGDDYLVVIDRRDTSITLIGTDGVARSNSFPGRNTYALISKDDYWNSVPNYRIIEDKLG